jgi:DNA-binding response OmpR family regulator
MKKAKILYLEDEVGLNETVTEFLEEQGYDVVSVFDGSEAQDKLYESSFDLLIFDVNVPEPNGFELLRYGRQQGIQSPAIFVTSRAGIEDVEYGFESGADDYIRKPYALKELALRIEVLLKRKFFHQEFDHLQINEQCAFDQENNQLICDKERVTLQDKELKLLKLFLEHRGQTLTHETIAAHLWDYDETPSDQSLRTYIKNLRKALGKEQIESIKRVGYIFSGK